MARLIRYILIITRYVLALVFLAAGASMIDQYGLAQAYMVSTGLPGALLPWFILVVIAAAVSLIAGYRLEWAALAMALLAVTCAGPAPVQAASLPTFSKALDAFARGQYAESAALCWQFLSKAKAADEKYEEMKKK